MLEASSAVNGARRAAGLSQRELARRAGMPQSAIARIERGHHVPRVDTLTRILDACGFELRLGARRGDEVGRLSRSETGQVAPVRGNLTALGHVIRETHRGRQP